MADGAAFARATEIVRNQENAVVVVSAMSGVTDTLLHCFDLAVNQNVHAATTLFEEQLARHLVVARSFLSGKLLAEFESIVRGARVQVERVLRRIATPSVSLPALKDELVSYGEYLSANLLANVLRSLAIPATYVDAREVVVTDEEYGSANPLLNETVQRAREKLNPLIRLGKVPVLGGFVAATTKGQTTTLGRGGSDYSAATIGAVLNARAIQIWTDVNGVLTADPRVVPRAQTIPILSYQEAAELAYFGAKVLHPKTIQPAINRRIPVRVLNSREPDNPGTLIVSESQAAPQTIKVIAHKSNITTIQITSARMLGAYGFLQALFAVFARHRTVVDIVTTSEVSVSLSLDDPSSLDQIVVDLKSLGQVEIEKRRTIISVIGEGLRNTPGVAATVFSILRDINVSMISLGASSINLTLMVDNEDAHEAITRLHHSYFETERAKAALVNAANEVGA